LAVSNEFKGLTIGTMILDYIKSSFLDEEENKTGCRFLTVDAYIAAVPFYEKNWFSILTDKDENMNTRLLVFDLAENKLEYYPLVEMLRGGGEPETRFVSPLLRGEGSPFRLLMYHGYGYII
jgi:hypothetical protein